MLGQIIAEILTFVVLHPLFGILDDNRVFTGQRTDDLLLADKEMGTVVVENIHGRERPFAIGNQEIGGNGIVPRISSLRAL